jgi:hypothetical protein
MHRNYEDIIQRAGDPLWYDDQGVPRYEAFKPGMCDVYAGFVAYLRIHCQECLEELKVATSVDAGIVDVDLPIKPPLPPTSRVIQIGKPKEHTTNDPWQYVGDFNYGDPPDHHCTGDSMGSVPMEIVEFWKRNLETQEWVRDSNYEFKLPKFERSFE